MEVKFFPDFPNILDSTLLSLFFNLNFQNFLLPTHRWYFVSKSKSGTVKGRFTESLSEV